MILPRLVAFFIALLGIVPLANYVTTGAGLPWWTVTVQQWLLWGGTIVIASLLAGRFATERIEALFERAEAALLALPARVFVPCACALGALLSLYFGWRMFGLRPVVGDEFAQRFHAALLAHGHLAARAPLPVEFFSTSETLQVGGRWFSQFPVGGPVLLAIGALAGAPWLVNPLLGAVAIAAIYDFVRSTCNETTARVTVLLAALCPMLFFMAGTQMNHTGTLALLWLALASLARWQRAADARASTRYAIAIGACVGIAATIRPFDAFVVALVIGAFQLLAGRSHRWLTRSIAIECAAGLIPVTLLLVANAATTGSPFPFAYDVLNGPEHRPGFHATPLGFDHTPRRGLYMASAYLMKLDIALFGWPLPALLFVVITLVALARTSAWDRLLLSLVLAFIAGYAAYWSESYFLGPRFLFVIAPVMILYTARMPAALRARVATPWLRAGVLLVIPLALLGSWVVPAGGTMQFGARQLAHLYRMRSGAAAIAAEVRRQSLDSAIVFLPESWHERLTARLRAVGVRPLSAEQVVSQADACTLHRALDSAEGLPDSPPGSRVQAVLNMIRADEMTMRERPMATRARVSLVPDRPLTPDCAAELARESALSVTVAEMLPHATFEADGSLGGRVIYARDLGRQNERLRAQFPGRRWYTARAALVNGEPAATVERSR